MNYTKQLFLFLCLAINLTAGSFDYKLDEVKENIESIMQSLEVQPTAGIKIISLSDGQTLYEKNAQALMVPASNVKLFTAAAAFAILGADYTFKTELLCDKQESINGIVEGNLYLKTVGDPSLVTQDLEELVLKLKSLGIERINGDVIIDTTIFDQTPFGPGWAWDDGAAFYNAPVGGFTINHNCIKVIVSECEGSSRIRLEPATDYVTVANNLQLISDGQSIVKVDRNWQDQGNKLVVSGTLLKDAPTKTYELSIEKPNAYGIALFKQIVNKHLTVQGEIKAGAVGKSIMSLATHESQPLRELLKCMLKSSDNLYAECICKSLGAKLHGLGSWSNGRKALTTFIADQLHINPQHCNLVDGSGLSRYNLLSAQSIIALLTWLFNEKMDDVIYALPEGGIDGTLQNRMQGTHASGKVWAKTGSLGGVSALSGYVTTQDNILLAFSILLNGFTKPGSYYKTELEDKICQYLASLNLHE